MVAFLALLLALDGVVTLNIARKTNPQPILEELKSAGLGKENLFLLQEVLHPADGAGVADLLGAKLGMSVCYGRAFPWEGGYMGQAILSPYPITDCRTVPIRNYRIAWRSPDRTALTAVTGPPGHPVRVWNVHLDTRLNKEQRVEQLSTLVEASRNERIPVIIGGDFNSNGFAWVASSVPIPFGGQPEALRRYMKENGYTTCLTTRPTHDLGQQLDWVFVRGGEVTDPKILEMRFSDHHAVQVRLRLTNVARSTQ